MSIVISGTAFEAKGDSGANGRLTELDLFDRYSRGLEVIAKRAQGFGYEIVAFRTPSASSRFLLKPVDVQNVLVSLIESFNGFCDAAAAAGVDLKDGGPNLAWWVIREMRLRPPGDLFSHIDGSDVIEIYDDKNIQVFRSFNFFSLVSYSLDEIYTFEWWELYDRDFNIMERMVADVRAMLKGAENKVVLRPFPSHVVIEKFGRQKKVHEISHKCMSPLFLSNGTVGGYIGTFREINPVSV